MEEGQTIRWPKEKGQTKIYKKSLKRYLRGNQKRKSEKDGQCNGQKKKDKRTNNDLQNTTQN